MARVMINGGAAHDPLSSLNSLLAEQPHRFLQPTLDHQQAALNAAKAILDPLAADIIASQTTRRNESRRKRKRGSNDVEDPILQLKQVYTNGLAVKQVWEQARRILDAALNETEHEIETYLETSPSIPTQLNDISQDDESASLGSFLDDDLSEDDMSRIGSEDDEEHDEGVAEDDEMFDLDEEDDIGEDMDVDPTTAADSDDEDGVNGAEVFKPDPNNLNDGFFSIDDFNKQSQFLEQMDARGDDDNPSDEDEVDWDADPLSQNLTISKATARKPQNRKNATHDEDQSSEEEEEGPTFGNANLDQSDGSDLDGDESDGGELDGMMLGLANTNDVRYSDFFEPPPKKLSKTKRLRALPKTQPPKDLSTAQSGPEGSDPDLERAMADVKRDLLDSEDEEDDMDDASDDYDSDVSSALPRLSKSKLADKNLSTHEKQQMQIAEEIRRLEALNVSKKPWTLSGEASAGARPINSLIEEDLDFERTGKPVPVITAEISNDIEALIKRRILARDFDEVTRRTPTTMSAAADARRGRSDAVVDDSKPTAGLGEIYESEYQRNADPTSYIDKRSAATKKQHDEIDRLWKEVREQLDVLGNLHFKPKRAEVEVKTVEDKPRISMEDARPAVSGSGIDVDGGMLAPQEIFKPGSDSRAENGEVLNAKSGISRSKEEMTREEKLRRRRREKERQKKSVPTQDAKLTSNNGKGKSAGKADLLKDLQKGGVQVVGKGGKLESLSTKKQSGKAEAEQKLPTSSSALKL